jgi:hypothetical protein
LGERDALVGQPGLEAPLRLRAGPTRAALLLARFTRID